MAGQGCPRRAKSRKRRWQKPHQPCAWRLVTLVAPLFTPGPLYIPQILPWILHPEDSRRCSSGLTAAPSPPPTDHHEPHLTPASRHPSRTRPQPCSRERSRVRVTSDSADARRPTDRPVNQPQSATVTRPPSRGSPLRHLPLLVQTPPHNPDPSPPPSRRAQHSSTPCLLARRHPATVTQPPSILRRRRAWPPMLATADKPRPTRAPTPPLRAPRASPRQSVNMARPPSRHPATVT